MPIDAAVSQAAAAGAADLDQRLADMDAEGIDVQVLFGGLVIGLTSFDDAGFALDFAQAYNDWLLDKVCAHSPERLKGVAVAPAQDVARAVGEIERAAEKGAVAVTVPPVIGDRNLDDPSLLPLFEAADDLDLAVCVHSAPGMNVPLPAAGRFANYAQVHCLSFPVDQMVALTALAMGGVLDRFPALRVGFMESGIGWVPYFVHRMHEHHEKLSHLLPHLETDPRPAGARPVLLQLRGRGAAARAVRRRAGAGCVGVRIGLPALGLGLPRHRRRVPREGRRPRPRGHRPPARRQRHPPVRVVGARRPLAAGRSVTTHGYRRTPEDGTTIPQRTSSMASVTWASIPSLVTSWSSVTRPGRPEA